MGVEPLAMLPGQVHLVMVGTSVLRNALRRLGAGDADCRSLVEACADPRKLDRGRCRVLQEAGEPGAQNCLEKLADMLEADPFGMSAELNAMDWLLQGSKPCRSVEEIKLYATDTPEALTAAGLLSRFLGQRCPGASVEVKRVGGVEAGFWPALLSLVKMIHEDAFDAVSRGKMVFLNATAGFKPESAAALLAAMTAGPVAAYYKHESMRETVLPPMIPLRLDQGKARAITAKLRFIAVERLGETISLSDPDLRDVLWLLVFLIATGAAKTAADGSLVVDERVAEVLETIAAVYDALMESMWRP